MKKEKTFNEFLENLKENYMEVNAPFLPDGCIKFEVDGGAFVDFNEDFAEAFRIMSNYYATEESLEKNDWWNKEQHIEVYLDKKEIAVDMFDLCEIYTFEEILNFKLTDERKQSANEFHEKELFNI